MGGDVSNILFYMVLMIVFWIVFAQLDKLKSADKNCCTTQSCGKDAFDGFFWNTFLAFGIMSTIAFIYYSGMAVVKMRRGGRGFNRMPLS